HGIIIEHDNLIDKDNPHVWMSPLNAINMTGRIFNAIHAAETNTSLQGQYVANKDAFIIDLNETAILLQNTTLLYSRLEDYNVTVHHPAFKYFLDILGVQRIASIEEGGAHGEPDPEHLAEVINAMKSNNTKVIINQPQLDDADVKEIAKETGAHVADLTPLLGIKGIHTYIDMIVFDLIQLLNPVDPFTGGGKSVPGYSVFVMAGCLFLTAIVTWFTRFRKREKAVKAA
ncbi:hypothetical protein GF325_08035, partial [Candidatus Bathyarchaeota archaeon]|nr:hypothetical protein [Candidatus Bathyarchaeota archaeon]